MYLLKNFAAASRRHNINPAAIVCGLFTTVVLYRTLSDPTPAFEAQDGQARSPLPDVVHHAYSDEQRNTSNESPADHPLEAVPAQVDWNGVEADDYPTYIANMRAIGTPEITIQRVVMAELQNAYNAERRDLLAKEPIGFWEAGFGNDETELPAYIALDQKQRAEMAFLLSINDREIEIPEDNASVSDLHVGGSLAPKAAAILAAESQIAAASDEIISSAGERVLTPAEDARLVQLRQEREQALSSILTPAERENFELRNSPASEALRESLRETGAKVTESEFRELFKARQSYQRSLELAARGQGNLGEAWDRYLSAANRILGPERSISGE